MTRPPRSVHLDELEAIPGPGTLTWHPVRAHLGVRAFGCNAYSAQRVGDDVIEPHDEDPELAHEELYFVARGRATFTLDDETIDAPAGTYVFVPDTATHRHAVAAEAATTVLSFGGPPTFTPSAWEWMFRAMPLAQSDPAAARAIVEDGLEHHPESPGLRISLARVRLAEGDEDGARAALRDALQRDSGAEDYVRQDAALGKLL
ncbi:MAG TPA: cupin domain-containing protein [Solirubrobacteraceae bacterium]